MEWVFAIGGVLAVVGFCYCLVFALCKAADNGDNPRDP